MIYILMSTLELSWVYFSLFVGFFSCNSFKTMEMAAVKIDIYHLLLEISSHYFIYLAAGSLF